MTNDPPSRDPLLGTILEDRYEIIEQVGRGGMSTVYRARQLRMDRDVAIKLLRHDRPMSDGAIGRFQREARVASLLKHPNTIVTYDFGASTAGLYIAMELLEGMTLTERLAAAKALPQTDALLVAAGIAASLAEAHSHGIVHRDLKPSNVFLNRVRDMEVVKVLDFGIAKFVSDAVIEETTQPVSASTSTSLYQTSMVQGRHMLIGTCYYMAPEVGKGEAADARSDIYSLGAMLFEMLVGHPPFEGATFQEVVLKHIESPLPNLPELIDEELRVLITVMLAKDPARRPRSADEVVSALKRIMGESGTDGVVTLASTPIPTKVPEVHPLAETAGFDIDYDDHHATPTPSSEKNEPTKEPPAIPEDASSPKADKTSGTRAKKTVSDTPRRISAKVRKPTPQRRLHNLPSKPILGGIGAICIIVAAIMFWPGDASTPRTSQKNGNPAEVTGTTSRTVGLNAVPDDWRPIKAATFRMGSADEVHTAHPSERPAHRVRITRNFRIFRTEITRAQWRDVLGVVPELEDACGDQCPVTNITWFDAVVFVNRLSELENRPRCYELQDCAGQPGDGLSCAAASFSGVECSGYRIPTEAEWELAARAVDTSALSLRSLEGNAPQAAALRPAGQGQPTAWGLFDVLGSVGEWTHDRYSATYYQSSPAVDPSGPTSGDERTWRDCTFNDTAAQCRFAVRRFASAGGRAKYIGLRPVISESK